MQVEEHLDVQLGVARRVDDAAARLGQQVALVRGAGQHEAPLLEEVCRAGGQKHLNIQNSASGISQGCAWHRDRSGTHWLLSLRLQSDTDEMGTSCEKRANDRHLSLLIPHNMLLYGMIGRAEQGG